MSANPEDAMIKSHPKVAAYRKFRFYGISTIDTVFVFAVFNSNTGRGGQLPDLHFYEANP